MFWLFQKKVRLKSHNLILRTGKELFYQGRQIKILSIKDDYIKVKNYVNSGCSISLIPLDTFIEEVSNNDVNNTFDRNLYVCR